MAKLSRDATKKLFGAAKTAAKDASGFAQLPPGQYKAQLVKCEVYEAKSGKMFVRHFWNVLEGEQEGRQAQDYRPAESENGIKFTLIEWAKLGADVDSVDDYDSMEKVAKLIQAAKPICTLRIAQSKNNPEMQNMYIQAVLEAEAPEAGAGTPEAEAEAEAGEDQDDVLDVGDLIEFKHNGETVQKPILAMDEDAGTILVKVGKEKISLTIDQVIRKVAEE